MALCTAIEPIIILKLAVFTVVQERPQKISRHALKKEQKQRMRSYIVDNLTTGLDWTMDWTVDWTVDWTLDWTAWEKGTAPLAQSSGIGKDFYKPV